MPREGRESLCEASKIYGVTRDGALSEYVVAPALPPFLAFVGREQSVLGSFGMDRADIEDLLALVAAGKMDLSASVSARYPLAEANAALRHLAEKRSGVVRIVVEPGG